jgi:hypothetical protein
MANKKDTLQPRFLLCVPAHSMRNSIATKAENNRLEAKQYPAIQRNLTKNTIDCGTRSKARFRRRISHVPNLMQMNSNNRFCSFALNSAHVRCDV